MPPFGLLIGSMLLQAVALYVSRKTTESKEEWNFLRLGQMLLFSLVCGLLFNAAPEHLTALNSSLKLGLSTEDTIFGGFCMLSIVHCVLFSSLGSR